jgi:Tropinone reductase 1
VCNAGTNTQLPSLQYTAEDYARIMGTNLEATYALCQLMQPLLAAGAAAGGAGSSGSSTSSAPAASQQQQQRQPPPGPMARACAAPKGDACITFISSVAGGPLAGRSGSLYAASKAALNQLAASLACEWAGAGIRVNSVAPWVTLTELGKQVSRGRVLLSCVAQRVALPVRARP